MCGTKMPGFLDFPGSRACMVPGSWEKRRSFRILLPRQVVSSTTRHLGLRPPGALTAQTGNLPTALGAGAAVAPPPKKSPDARVLLRETERGPNYQRLSSQPSSPRCTSIPSVYTYTRSLTPRRSKAGIKRSCVFYQFLIVIQRKKKRVRNKNVSFHCPACFCSFVPRPRGFTLLLLLLLPVGSFARGVSVRRVPS